MSDPIELATAADVAVVNAKASWSGLPGKPAVIAGGDTAAAARTAINAADADAAALKDTGWRGISYLIMAGRATQILVRRVGSRVLLRGTGVTITGTQHLLSLPPGFRAMLPPVSLVVALRDSDGLNKTGIYRIGNADGELWAATPSSGAELFLEFTTDQAWPATLPGTPV